MAQSLPLGATLNDNGDVVIPASRRPDGTWRKEKKLRPGYIAQDEVARFETRGTKHQKYMANRLPPGMAPEPEEKKGPITASQRKNAARAASRKAKKAAEKEEASKVVVEEVEDATEDMAELKVTEAMAELKVTEAPAETLTPAPVDRSKKIKALSKKIRQVEELEAKVTAGELVPSEDQRQKLARKGALLAELAELEG